LIRDCRSIDAEKKDILLVHLGEKKKRTTGLERGKGRAAKTDLNEKVTVMVGHLKSSGERKRVLESSGSLWIDSCAPLPGRP
jgi:hypothetical protein